MRGRDLVLISGLCLCLALAIGSGFFILGGGTNSMFAMVVAIFALAFGQVFLLGVSTTQSSDFHNRVRAVQTEQQSRHHLDLEYRRQTEFMMGELTALRNDAARNADLVAAGFSDLKETYANLAGQIQTASTAVLPPPPVLQPLLENRTRVPPAPVTLDDDLTLALEPIIDLQRNSTAHYRIHLGLASQFGTSGAHDSVLNHADRNGIRTQLDITVAREAALLLRRLRARDSNLMIFMPIGAATLSSPKAMSQILVDRQTDYDVAQGLAFEVPHAMLAGLTDQALEGLATLARNGVALALTNASLSGLDINALATLNVHFVSLDIGALGNIETPNHSLSIFAQIARAARVQLIVSGVTNPRIISNLPQITNLACGPCFAAPRRVKRDAAVKFTAAA